MQLALLELVACPKCLAGGLELSDSILPVEKHPPDEADLIFEGTLRCSICHSSYPVIAGVPLLVVDYEDYISKRKHEFLEVLCQIPMSPNCRRLIVSAKEALYGPNNRRESWETIQGLEVYFRHHYSKECFPPESPLSSIISNSETLYSKISNTYFKESEENSTLVDLGCGVGGNIYHMGDRFHVCLGTDYSFSAMFIASRLFESGIVPEFYNVIPDSQAMPAPTIDLDLVRKINAFFFVSDITKPAISSECGDAVILANVIDICPDPSIIVQSACALTKRGGELLTITPFYWRPDRTPPSKWLEGDGEGPEEALPRLLRSFAMEPHHSQAFFPWILSFYPRYAQVWLCHALLSRRL